MIECIGETVIDIIGNEHFIGGCPLNTAIASARMGSTVGYIGEISSDEYGNEVLEYLINNLVMFEPLMCSNKLPTLKAVATTNGGVTNYTFSSEPTVASYASEEKLISTFSQNSGIRWVFTGSLAFSFKNVRDSVVNACRTIPDADIYLDLNIRDAYINDEYIPDLKKTMGICRIVKASDEDLKKLCLSDSEALLLCKENLIVTKGSNGSTWYVKSTGKSYNCDAFPVECFKDTVGCGDTYNGTVLSMLDKTENTNFEQNPEIIKEIMTKASIAASINCSRTGCNPPYENEVNVGNKANLI